MVELKRWTKMNTLFLVAIVLILAFAWMDARQIVSFHVLNTEQGWDLYSKYTGPAIWTLWGIVLIALGLIWYIVSGDKSEAVAISASSLLLIFGGLEDVLYFMFARPPVPNVMPDCMTWFIFPQNFVSKLMGETCVSKTALLLNVALFSVLAFIVYRKLKRAKW